MPIGKPLEECQQEAYIQVLRAFQAQKSNDWSRQKLLINLRRELKISNEKHLNTLGEVVNDSELRELTGGAGSRERTVRQSSETIPDASARNAGAHTSNHKQPQTRETSQDTSHDKCLLRQSKRSHSEARSSKECSHGKKDSPSKGVTQGNHTPNPNNFPGAASMAPPLSRKPRNTPSNSGGRAPNSTTSTLTPSVPPPNIHHLGPDNINKFVGRQVESFWQDQNPQWIEAVITDYNVETRKHCLTYDFNSVNESWEWVELDKMLSEGQVRLLGGPSLAPEVLAGAGRIPRVGGQAQVGPFDTVLGKRAYPAHTNRTNGFGDSMQAPFDCDFFDKKLQHGSVEELEAMHRSVLKRQRVVMDRLLELGDEGLKLEDPLVKALVERERLSQHAEELAQELSLLGSQEK